MKYNLPNSTRFIVLCLVLACSTISVRAQVPSDLMSNCNQWKITYPTGDEDKTLCNEPNNEFYFVNGSGDAIVFRVPIRSNNGSTPNSSYIRSELRERESDGSADIYWTTTGTHMIYVKQAITHLPMIKPHLVATQIHGNKADGIDDSMVMRLEDSHLFLSFNGGQLRSDLTIKTNYALGTVHEVIFLVVDGKHYCYYSEDGNLLNAYTSGSASSYLVKDGSNDFVMDLNYDQSYFKVGNYTQSNPDKEGNNTDDPNNYGEVLVYDFAVQHGNAPPTTVDVTGVSFSSNTIALSLGSIQQLSTSISPSNASNQAVTYSSNNTAVATVSSSGVVTAVSEGNATITVTTDDGGLTDTVVITVTAPSTGANLALNKPITGTGTADGTNVVANLVDGSTSTRWSVSGFPQTATIDLGAVFTLGRTEVVCYSDRDYQYTVSASATANGTYTQIVDRSANTTPGTVASPITDVFTGIDARYVKITVTGAASYTGSWMSLLEFRVFAGEGTSPASLPAPWESSDVGAVGAAGSASYDNGTFTVQASGADIWNAADEFGFVYQSMIGDGQVIAKVNSIGNTHSWAKGGVMIRESLAAGSKHAIAVVTPAQGVSFQRRAATGGSSAHTTIPGINAPEWVKLTRTGDLLTASYSDDGVSWTVVGSATISMSSSVYVGLCVSSHADGSLTTATFSNVTAGAPPVVANVALNKSVTASSEQSNNPATNLVDGDVDSRWSAQNYPQSLVGPEMLGASGQS